MDWKKKALDEKALDEKELDENWANDTAGKQLF